MSQTASIPYRELAESTLKDDRKNIDEIDHWVEKTIGKKSDVQADLQAYVHDMAAAKTMRHEARSLHESQLAQMRAAHSAKIAELVEAESKIIKSHPTMKKVTQGVDSIIVTLLKTQREIEELDRIQQRLYGDEDVDRILKKPQDNVTDRVAGLIQAEKERLQKICSCLHSQLCYFRSVFTPKNDQNATPFDAAYTHRDLPFMEHMAQAMTITMPDTGPKGLTESLLDHTEEPATCDGSADESSPIMWNSSDNLVPSRDVTAPLSMRA